MVNHFHNNKYNQKNMDLTKEVVHFWFEESEKEDVDVDDMSDMGEPARTARITFYKNEDMDKWSFGKCEFTTQRKTYNYKDWCFLVEIKKEIDNIEKHLNK